MSKSPFSLLPPTADLETKPVLKKMAANHRGLATLDSFSRAISNRDILVNDLCAVQQRLGPNTPGSRCRPPSQIHLNRNVYFVNQPLSAILSTPFSPDGM